MMNGAPSNRNCRAQERIASLKRRASNQTTLAFSKRNKGKALFGGVTKSFNPHKRDKVAGIGKTYPRCPQTLRGTRSCPYFATCGFAL